MGGTAYDFGDNFEAWVIQTRRAQGLPDHIVDPVTLLRVAELLHGCNFPLQERDLFFPDARVRGKKLITSERAETEADGA